jgi:hypothetical protein
MKRTRNSRFESSRFRRPAQRRLRTVHQFCSENPAFTPGGLRWLLFHRNTNGLAQAVVKCGRCVLIDVDAFFTWLDAQNGRGEARENGKA